MITLWSKFWCIRVSQEQQQKFPHGDLRLFWRLGVNSSTPWRRNSTGNLLSIRSVEFDFQQKSWKICLPSIHLSFNRCIVASQPGPRNSLFPRNIFILITKPSVFPQKSWGKYIRGIWICKWIHSKMLRKIAKDRKNLKIVLTWKYLKWFRFQLFFSGKTWWQ